MLLTPEDERGGRGRRAMRQREKPESEEKASRWGGTRQRKREIQVWQLRAPLRIPARDREKKEVGEVGEERGCG